MRSAISALCVGDPPGELIASATACTPSAVKARLNDPSTVSVLSCGRPNPTTLEAITPCNRTTATTGECSPDMRAGSLSDNADGIFTMP